MIGESSLLIERVERPLLVLFMVALFTTTPSMGILSAGALIFQLLILLLSFGTYQDTHQHASASSSGFSSVSSRWSLPSTSCWSLSSLWANTTCAPSLGDPSLRSSSG